VTAVPAVALRAVRPGDADGMLTVLHACERSWASFAPADWTPPPAGAAHWVTELEDGREWAQVAEESDAVMRSRIVGFASWGEARDQALGPVVDGVANLNALFVHPDRWRRGIATRLLDAAVGAMRAAGYRWARLFTPQGAPAEQFYAARGWIADGRLAWHHVLGFAVVGYALEL
jgi:GNAT superfamily N-acetyltransferase